MTTPINSVISGIQIPVHAEVTSGEVKQEFLENVAVIDAILNLTDSDPAALSTAQFFIGDNPTPVTGADAALTAAIQNLIILGRDGIPGTVDPSDPTSRPITYYLTLEMSTRLDKLLETMEIVGIIVNASGATPTVTVTNNDIRQLIDFALLSPIVTEILGETIAAGQRGTRSLQALIELDYVRTGNEILSDKLEDLEESLTVTRGALQALTALQDLHNQVTTFGKGEFGVAPFEFSFTGSEPFFRPGASNVTAGDRLSEGTQDRKLFISVYEQVASSYFGTPINPSTLVGPNEQFQSIGAMKNRAIEILASINEQIAIITQVAPSAEILERLNAVRSDLVLATSGAGTGNFALWMIDFYGVDESGNAVAISEVSGTIQQNITFAIAAGEAFNDTQKEEVRRFLFVFEEYYKSASAILSKITQIIEKIAQGIART